MSELGLMVLKSSNKKKWEIFSHKMFLLMINPFYSKTGGMQAEKCEQVKMVLTIVCGIYLIIVESLKGLKSEITIEKKSLLWYTL